MLNSIFRALQPRTTAYAHCDLPCGVYDPSQARLEAESVKACMEKYHASDDPEFRARAVSIKEERSHMVKEHLWVLWTDYFKPDHLATFPDLHDTFWKAAKLCSACKVNIDQAKAEELMAAVEKIHGMFWQSKGRSDAWVTAS